MFRVAQDVREAEVPRDNGPGLYRLRVVITLFAVRFKSASMHFALEVLLVEFDLLLESLFSRLVSMVIGTMGPRWVMSGLGPGILGISYFRGLGPLRVVAGDLNLAGRSEHCNFAKIMKASGSECLKTIRSDIGMSKFSFPLGLKSSF